MPKRLVLILAVIVLLAANLLAFHDLFEPHTVRDFLTLVGSLLVVVYLGIDLIGRQATAGSSRH